MKNILFFLLLLTSTFCNGQDRIAVKTITIQSTLSFQSKNELPKVIALKKEFEESAKKINQFILEEYQIEDYQLKKDEDFRYSGSTFQYQIDDNYLFLKTAGGYLGAYPSEGENEYVFEIKTGEIVDSESLPFQALFTLNGYLDFVDKYWLKDIQKEFAISTSDCEGSPPFCSYYDIESYEVTSNKLSFSISNSCYPHAMLACSPVLNKTISKEILKPYLSDLGYRLLFKENYTSKKGIEKFLMNQKEKLNYENNIYFFGKMNNSYPISMALTLSKNDNTVIGYYYYDKKKQKIKLIGKYSKDTIELSEYTNNQNTGNFILKFEREYNDDGIMIFEPNQPDKYLTGKWFNDKSKYKIKFTTVKFNRFD